MEQHSQSPFLRLKLDALRTVLLCLTGREALLLVGNCCTQTYNLLINQNDNIQEEASCQFLWSEFVRQECKAKEYQFHNQLIHKNRSLPGLTTSTSTSSTCTSSNNNPTTAPLHCWQRAYRKFTMRSNLNNLKWRQLKNDPNSPAARQGSAGATLTDGSLAIFGGWTTNGMGRALQVLHHCQEDHSFKWSKEIIPTGLHWNEFRPTYGHTLTALPGVIATGNGTCLLLLGGSTQGGYRGVVGCAHRLIVQPNGGESGAASEWWSNHRDGTVVPSCIERAYHSATFIQSDVGIHVSNASRVWIFGGFNDENGTITALQTLLVPQHGQHNETNTKTNKKKKQKYLQNDNSWKWENRVPDGEAPVGRFGHTVTVIGSRLFLAGGTTGTSNFKGRVDGEELTDELWCLDLSLSSEKLHWERIEMNINMTAEDIGKMSMGAFGSPMQRCHSATALGGSELILFGGGPPGNTTNELHLLDTSTSDMQCKLLEVTGRSPRPRQNHVVTTMLNGSVLILFGGCLARGNSEELGDTWILDLDYGFKVLEDGDLVADQDEEEEEEEEEEDDVFDMYAGELVRVQFPDGSVRVIPRELFEQYQRLQGRGEDDGTSDDEKEEKE